MKTKIFNTVECEEAMDIVSEYEEACDRSSIDSQLLHVITELTEVKDVLRNKDKKYGSPSTQQYNDTLLLEIADVVLSCLGAIRYISDHHVEAITAKKLNEITSQKLKILKDRLKKMDKEKEMRVKNQ